MAHAFPLAPSADDDEATLQNFSQFPRNCFLFVSHRLERELLRHPVCLSVRLAVCVCVCGIVRGSVTGDSVKWLQYVIRLPFTSPRSTLPLLRDLPAMIAQSWRATCLLQPGAAPFV